MNTTSEYTRALQSALERPSQGVVGLVDDLLNLCRKHSLQLDWQGDHFRVRSVGCEWEDLPDISLRKSVVRAILARIAALCNEQIPNSVTPYGGESELSVGANPQAIFRVTFVNTQQEQKLVLTSKSVAPAEAPSQCG
jgi:hypothetical protein